MSIYRYFFSLLFCLASVWFGALAQNSHAQATVCTQQQVAASPTIFASNAFLEDPLDPDNAENSENLKKNLISQINFITINGEQKNHIERPFNRYVGAGNVVGYTITFNEEVSNIRRENTPIILSGFLNPTDGSVDGATRRDVSHIFGLSDPALDAAVRENKIRIVEAARGIDPSTDRYTIEVHFPAQDVRLNSGQTFLEAFGTEPLKTFSLVYTGNNAGNTEQITDASGNIFCPQGTNNTLQPTPIVYTFDPTTPRLDRITFNSQTADNEVVFNVEFNRPVSALAASNFTATHSDSSITVNVESVARSSGEASGAEKVWQVTTSAVTPSTLDAAGSFVRLQLINSTGIVMRGDDPFIFDSSLQPFGLYQRNDTTAPTIISLVRNPILQFPGGNEARTDERVVNRFLAASWVLTFSEPVKGVDVEGYSNQFSLTGIEGDIFFIPLGSADTAQYRVNIVFDRSTLLNPEETDPKKQMFKFNPQVNTDVTLTITGAAGRITDADGNAFAQSGSLADLSSVSPHEQFVFNFDVTAPIPSITRAAGTQEFIARADSPFTLKWRMTLDEPTTIPVLPRDFALGSRPQGSADDAAFTSLKNGENNASDFTVTQITENLVYDITIRGVPNTGTNFGSGVEFTLISHGLSTANANMNTGSIRRGRAFKNFQTYKYSTDSTAPTATDGMQVRIARDLQLERTDINQQVGFLGNFEMLRGAVTSNLGTFTRRIANFGDIVRYEIHFNEPVVFEESTGVFTSHATPDLAIGTGTPTSAFVLLDKDDNELTAITDVTIRLENIQQSGRTSYFVDVRMPTTGDAYIVNPLEFQILYRCGSIRDISRNNLFNPHGRCSGSETFAHVAQFATGEYQIFFDPNFETFDGFTYVSGDALDAANMRQAVFNARFDTFVTGVTKNNFALLADDGTTLEIASATEITTNLPANCRTSSTQGSYCWQITTAALPESVGGISLVLANTNNIRVRGVDEGSQGSKRVLLHDREIFLVRHGRPLNHRHRVPFPEPFTYRFNDMQAPQVLSLTRQNAEQRIKTTATMAVWRLQFDEPVQGVQLDTASNQFSLTGVQGSVTLTLPQGETEPHHTFIATATITSAEVVDTNVGLQIEAAASSIEDTSTVATGTNSRGGRNIFLQRGDMATLTPAPAPYETYIFNTDSTSPTVTITRAANQDLRFIAMQTTTAVWNLQFSEAIFETTDTSTFTGTLNPANFSLARRLQTSQSANPYLRFDSAEVSFEINEVAGDTTGTMFTLTATLPMMVASGAIVELALATPLDAQTNTLVDINGNVFASQTQGTDIVLAGETYFYSTEGEAPFISLQAGVFLTDETSSGTTNVSSNTNNEAMRYVRANQFVRYRLSFTKAVQDITSIADDGDSNIADGMESTQFLLSDSALNAASTITVTQSTAQIYFVDIALPDENFGNELVTFQLLYQCNAGITDTSFNRNEFRPSGCTDRNDLTQTSQLQGSVMFTFDPTTLTFEGFETISQPAERTVMFRATFGTPVTGLETTDFSLTTSDSSTATIEEVVALEPDANNFASQWQITTSEIATSATSVEIIFVATDITARGAATATVPPPQSTEQRGRQFSFNDADPPTIQTFTRNNPERTKDGNVTWTLTFSEPVNGVDIDGVSSQFNLINPDNTPFTGGTVAVTIADDGVTSLPATTFTITPTFTASPIVDTPIGLSLVSTTGIVDTSTSGGTNNNGPNAFARATGEIDENQRYILNFDTAPPTITSLTRQAPTTEIVPFATQKTITWEVEFSEAVTEVGPEDFAPSYRQLGTNFFATGTADGTITPVSASVYRVQFTLQTNRDSGAEVNLAVGGANDIRDLNDNRFDRVGDVIPAGAEFRYSTELTPPTVAVELDDTYAYLGNTINYTLTFNENVTNVLPANFSLSDSTLSSATITVNETSSTVYEVAVTMPATYTGGNQPIPFTLNYAGNAITDTTLNQNAFDASTFTSPSATFDPAPLTFGGFTATGDSTTRIATFTANFDIPVNGVAANDFEITAQSGSTVPTINTPTAISPDTNGFATQWQITLTALDDSPPHRVTLGIKSVNGINPRGDQTGITISTQLQTTEYTFTDSTPPTILRVATVGETRIRNPGNISWTLTFSEPVTGVSTNNFALTGSATGTITNVEPSTTSRTFTITANITDAPTQDTPVGLSLANTTDIVDTSVNGGTDGNSANTLQATTGEIDNRQQFTANFDNDAPTVMSVVRKDGVAQLIPSSATPMAIFTITFSESVQNVEPDDFRLTYSQLDGSGAGLDSAAPTISGSGNVYDLTFALNPSGQDSGRQIRLVANTGANPITDTTGNENAFAFTQAAALTTGTNEFYTYSTKRTAPTVTVTIDDSYVYLEGTINYTLTFNENVQGVANGTFTLSEATLSSLTPTITGSDDTYTVTFTLPATFATREPISFTLNYAGTAITDTTLNENQFIASTFTSPTATFDPAPLTFAGLAADGDMNTRIATFTASFDIPVNNVMASDFEVTAQSGSTVPTINQPTAIAADTNGFSRQWQITLTALEDVRPYRVTLGIKTANTITPRGDATGITIPGTVAQTHEHIFIDRTRPTIASVATIGTTRLKRVGNISWELTFSEPVTGVSTSNFALMGFASGTISSVTPTTTSTTFTITANITSATQFDTQLGLSLANTTGIVDTSINGGADNNSPNALMANTGEIDTSQQFTINFDITAPRVLRVERANDAEELLPFSTTPMAIFTITFTEEVQNVEADDFRLTYAQLGGAAPFPDTEAPTVSGSGRVYNLTFPLNPMGQDSGRQINLIANPNPPANPITDITGNENALVVTPGGALTTATNEFYTYSTDGTAPTVDISAQVHPVGASPRAAVTSHTANSANQYTHAGDMVTYTLTFSEEVSGIRAMADGKSLFGLNQTALNDSSQIAIREGTGNVYFVDVTLPIGTFATQDFNLVYSGGDTIKDVNLYENPFVPAGAGNNLQTTPIEFTFDATALTFSNISFHDETNRVVTFRVIFGTPVSGVSENNFTFTSTNDNMAGIAMVRPVGTAPSDTWEVVTDAIAEHHEADAILRLANTNGIDPRGAVAAGSIRIPAGIEQMAMHPLADTFPPTISSLVKDNLLPATGGKTRDGMVTWTLTFSEPVRGVDIDGTSDQFKLRDNDGNDITGGTVEVRSMGSDTTFRVTPNLNATPMEDTPFNLAFASGNTGITDTSTTGTGTDGRNPFASTANAIIDMQAQYIANFDLTPPTVVITRTTPAAERVTFNGDTATHTITWTLTFDENTSGVEMDDFAIYHRQAGSTDAFTELTTATNIILTETTATSVYQLSATLPSTGLDDADYEITLGTSSTFAIQDTNFNDLDGITNNVFDGTENYNYSTDNVAPTLTNISAQVTTTDARTKSAVTNNTSNAADRYTRATDTITYTLTFSESVEGITAGDGKTLFALSNTELNTASTITIAENTGTANSFLVSVMLPPNEIMNSDTTPFNFHLTYIGGTTIDDANPNTNPYTAETNGELQADEIIFTYDSTQPTFNMFVVTTEIDERAVMFEARFNTPVSNVTMANFNIVATEIASVPIATLTPMATEPTTIWTIAIAELEFPMDRSLEDFVTISLANVTGINPRGAETQIFMSPTASNNMLMHNLADTIPPEIQSLTRMDSADEDVEAGDEIIWNLTFSEDVSGVEISGESRQFQLTGIQGTVSVSAPASQPTDSFIVTAQITATSDDQETIGLSVNPSPEIVDTSDTSSGVRGSGPNLFMQSGNFNTLSLDTFETYNLPDDTTPPTITAINSTQVEGTRNVTWQITFSEPVRGLSQGSFTLSENTSFANNNFSVAPDSLMLAVNGGEEATFSNMWTFTTTTSGNYGGTPIIEINETNGIFDRGSNMVASETANTELPRRRFQFPVANITMFEKIISTSFESVTAPRLSGETANEPVNPVYIEWRITYDEDVPTPYPTTYRIVCIDEEQPCEENLPTATITATPRVHTIRLTGGGTNTPLAAMDGTLKIENGALPFTPFTMGLSDMQEMLTTTTIYIDTRPPEISNEEPTLENPSGITAPSTNMWTVTATEPIRNLTENNLSFAPRLPEGVTPTISPVGQVPTATWEVTIPEQPNPIRLAAVPTQNENDATDLAGNFLRAGPTAEEIMNHTNALIQSFIERQANKVISNIPSLSARLNRLHGGLGFARGPQRFNMDMGDGLWSMDYFGSFIFSLNNIPSFDIFPSRRGAEVWSQVSYSSTKGEGEAKATTMLVNIGADMNLSKNVIVGVLGQFDLSEEESDSFELAQQSYKSNLESKGWLVGPYIVMQSDVSDLVLEGLVSYGKSEVEISPLGTYRDTYETERLLGSLGITRDGVVAIRDWHLSPKFKYTFYGEQHEGYTDSSDLRNEIIEQTVRYHRLELGPSFSTTWVRQDGSELIPIITFSGLYDYNESAGINEEQFSGKVDINLIFRGTSGIDWNIGGYYEGLGAEIQTYGLSAGLGINY